jgi:tetratricopeptide (TPR) repeat protein
MPARPTSAPQAKDDSAAGRLIADIQRATQLLAQGHRGEALVIYHDVSKRAGRAATVQLQLGHLCRQFGDIDEAVSHYAIAAAEMPDNAVFQYALGQAYLDAHELEKARETLEKTLELDPDHADARHTLGMYYMHLGDHASAIEHLERACELKPGDTHIQTNVGISLGRLNRHEEALKHIEKALKLDDSNQFAYLGIGEVLAEIGNMEEANKRLEQALRKYPALGSVYSQLARNKKFTEQDSAFMRKAEKVLDRGMPAKERYSLLFGLGKMHDDCGHYDQAFDFFQQANVLQKKLFDLDGEEDLRKALAKAFTPKSLKIFADRGNPSRQPVFIVGMPRSGTTLMERIIASHPQGAGAGELPTMPLIANSIFPVDNWRKAAARIQSTLSAEKIETLAERYLDILGQGREGADRIVDKMPSNFLFVGLIKAIFPNATIIHAMRHPLDACLSCYFQPFGELRWANDMSQIAGFYNLYRESIAYWHKTLPEGSILDVQYEQLVEDPETHARRMIEACGLEWDPTVLDFFRKKGVVRTASIAQTRQPIYKTSRARWINYARHLQPLANELASFLQHDRELLAEHGIDLPSGSGWLKRIMR